MLQAFSLKDTCRCITTSTSITQSKELRLWNLHCFLNRLRGRYLASQYHWHIGSWDDLLLPQPFNNPLLDLRDLVVHNLFNSAPLIDALVIDPTISPISSLTSKTFFVDILYIHAENLHNSFRDHNCGFSTSCSKCEYNRHFHDLFTWLTLYPKHWFRNCLHLRLIVCGRSHRRPSFFR